MAREPLDRKRRRRPCARVRRSTVAVMSMLPGSAAVGSLREKERWVGSLHESRVGAFDEGLRPREVLEASPVGDAGCAGVVCLGIAVTRAHLSRPPAIKGARLHRHQRVSSFESKPPIYGRPSNARQGRRSAGAQEQPCGTPCSKAGSETTSAQGRVRQRRRRTKSGRLRRLQRQPHLGGAGSVAGGDGARGHSHLPPR